MADEECTSHRRRQGSGAGGQSEPRLWASMAEWERVSRQKHRESQEIRSIQCDKPRPARAAAATSWGVAPENKLMEHAVLGPAHE